MTERFLKLNAQIAFFKAILKFCTTNLLFRKFISSSTKDTYFLYRGSMTYDARLQRAAAIGL